MYSLASQQYIVKPSFGIGQRSYDNNAKSDLAVRNEKHYKGREILTQYLPV